MAQPKKRTSPRKQGLRRSHLVLDLARQVNKTSPVKVYTTRRETGKKAKATVVVTTAPAATDKSKSSTSTNDS